MRGRRACRCRSTLAAPRSSSWKWATAATASACDQPIGPMPSRVWPMARPSGWAICRSTAQRPDLHRRALLLVHLRRQAVDRVAGDLEAASASRQLDGQRTEHTLTYTDPKTGLVVRCVGIEYRDFPTVEWTLYFKNASDKDTPILADIQAVGFSVGADPGPSSSRRSSGCTINGQPVFAERLPAV